MDVEPIGETEYVACPYGFNDAFKGNLADEAVLYMGRPVAAWLAERGLSAESIEGHHDLQAARIFPVCESIEEMGKVVDWMINRPSDEEGRAIWMKSRKLSADEISTSFNMTYSGMGISMH